MQVFTAQDARNIVEQERRPILGQVIDIIRDAAKRGYHGINLQGANVPEEILDTLSERGFDINKTDGIIGWGIKPDPATTNDDVVVGGKSTIKVVTDEEE